MIEGRQKAAGVGGDFLEDDGHIPRGLEAGSGRFRGWRLGVCRGGKEQDGQPHCFNLSRGTNQRPIKRGRWGFACCGVRNYSPPGGGGGVGGVTRDSASRKPLAQVRITAHNMNRGTDRTAISGPDGAFAVLALEPGLYQVAAAKEGFTQSTTNVYVATPRPYRVDLL